MPKFRKKPIVVDAYQTDKIARIYTLEGTMVADPGDWVITGVKGERYPCKPDVFELTYEPVETVLCNDLLRAIKCPGINGGCGSSGCWRITLDRQAKRIIADCINCGYRHSFPLDVDRLSNRYTGPIDETGKVVLRSWGRGVIDNNGT